MGFSSSLTKTLLPLDCLLALVSWSTALCVEGQLVFCPQHLWGSWAWAGSGRQRMLPGCCTAVGKPPPTQAASAAGPGCMLLCGLVLQTDAGTNVNPIMQTRKLTGECVRFAPGPGFMVVFTDPAL